jgi:alpha-beta hydrolase superfamily lysophospholipase
MKNPTYWKKYYVVYGNADEIERNIKLAHFTSGGKDFELVYFEKSKNAPNILISPGSAGHAYVFAELAYEMYFRGYNVFIMPKEGGHTVSELMPRHTDALKFVANNFNEKIGVFAEGLGGYVVFYLAFANGPMKSVVFQNAPAILTEKGWHEAILGGSGAAGRRKLILPFAKALLKIFPNIKLPIRLYLDFKELVDTKEENRRIEAPRIEAFLKDPDFDTSYPLRAIMSLISTPLPNPLTSLKIPTMFLVPVRGFGGSYYLNYSKDLYERLPSVKKKFVEVDGSVFWMCSHPKEAAEIISDWFSETL